MVMSVTIVLCTACEQPSRVPATALGLVVACPWCASQFVAVDWCPPSPPPPVVVRAKPSLPDDIPVVRPLARTPSVAEHPDDIPTVHPPQAGGGPVALALLPVGVPLLWLFLSLVARPSAFSFMAPVAIAAGTVGLGVGLACLRRWTMALRVRLLVALAVLSYGACVLFYFAQDGWLERVREVAAVTGLTWGEFRPKDQSFRLEAPGEATETECPVPDWNLTTRRFIDPKKAVDVYLVAYGNVPVGLGNWGDKPSLDAGFATARDAIATATNGTLLEERTVGVPNAESREYVFDLAGGKRRVVRLVRTETRLVYLGVEGQFLSADRRDVQRYLKSFRLDPPKK